MINANELRLGNWVIHPQEGFAQIGFISEHETATIEPGGWSMNGTIIKFLDPILINEEWMAKLGFKRIHVNNNHWTINLHINESAINYKLSIFSNEPDGWGCALSYELNGYKDFIIYNRVQFVHQLQNLYFALTGEELTIKTQL